MPRRVCKRLAEPNPRNPRLTFLLVTANVSANGYGRVSKRARRFLSCLTNRFCDSSCLRLLVGLCSGEDSVKRAILACVVCAVCTVTLMAQLSVDVSLVTLEATVTDQNGHYVPGLTASDFVVTEDGKEQKIALVEQS